ncbi:flagellar protein FlaG [Sedimenticola selenatireducens]|uniref:flagellar protein FlaG n=1 Tax=Sedimenticola selenatireducens TaxID=191960 RepID=UPI000688F8BA|nr:flagellar protein FlaG [Sedimenticola selenatireducens]
MVNEISQSVLSGLSAQSKGAASSTVRVRENSEIQRVAQSAQIASRGEAKEEQRPTAAMDGQTLDNAVEQLNQFAQSVQRKLEFSVDEESGKTVIKVIDKESGEMVRSIPSEDVLDMQQRLRETSEAIFKGNQGISLLFEAKA